MSGYSSDDLTLSVLSLISHDLQSRIIIHVHVRRITCSIGVTLNIRLDHWKVVVIPILSINPKQSCILVVASGMAALSHGRPTDYVTREFHASQGYPRIFVLISYLIKCLLFSGFGLSENYLEGLNITRTKLNMTNITHIAALSGGGAMIIINFSKVVEIDTEGHIVRDLYECKCKTLTTLLLIGDRLCAIHTNGTVAVFQLPGGKLLQIYNIPDVGTVYNFGSLYWNTDIIDPDLLLLADFKKRQVFSYRLSTKNKTIHATYAPYPHSVSYGSKTSNISFIVTYNSEKIILYTSSWQKIRTISDYGASKNIFKPGATLISPQNTLIVADRRGRVSEFTIEGNFIRYLDPGIHLPSVMSLSHQYLWVVSGDSELYQYKKNEQ